MLTHTDAKTYGLQGSSSTNSTFSLNGVLHNLPAPSLNISIVSNETFGYGNSTYNLTYIQEHGSCSELSTYKWGFSLLLLIITMGLTTLWMVITYGLWLHAYHNSRPDNSRWDMGTYRAVLDLASAMNNGINNSHGDDLNNISNHELKKRIQNDIRSCRIGYNGKSR